MFGSLNLDGAANLENSVLHVNGKSDLANGVLDFDFKDGVLVAKGSKLATSEILKMLSYPEVFFANIDANFNYDTKKQYGNFNATSPKGTLAQNQLGLLIMPLLKVDITKEEYKIDANGTLNKELIKFMFDMEAQNSFIEAKNGQINAGVLHIPLALKISNRDLNATISGKGDNIKVSLDGSAYVKDKITETLQDNNTKQKIQDVLKKL
ncbi:MAG: hypothetical protein ACK5LP_00700, partial [Campylobacteraceae bacterium]